jgi:hypothetical protein
VQDHSINKKEKRRTKKGKETFVGITKAYGKGVLSVNRGTRLRLKFKVTLAYKITFEKCFSS